MIWLSFILCCCWFSMEGFINKNVIRKNRPTAIVKMRGIFTSPHESHFSSWIICSACVWVTGPSPPSFSFIIKPLMLIRHQYSRVFTKSPHSSNLPVKIRECSLRKSQMRNFSKVLAGQVSLWKAKCSHHNVVNHILLVMFLVLNQKI